MKYKGELTTSVPLKKQIEKNKATGKLNGFSGSGRTVILGSIIPVTLLIIWEVLSRLEVFPAYQLPAPTVIFNTILTMAQDGTLWSHIGITTIRVFQGFILGTIVAIILGSLVGFYKKAEQLLDPMLQAFRSIPSLAWVPLFILWMGIGEPSKVTMIAVGVFFPVYLNIVSGTANSAKSVKCVVLSSSNSSKESSYLLHCLPLLSDSAAVLA